jgi:transcriptional regulator with XRE-family HTH domain
MNAHDYSTFGNALKSAISAARYSQAKLARELHIDPGQVSRWTNDKAIPHADTVGRIEQILGADLSVPFSASAPEHELYIAAPITGLHVDDIGKHNEAVAEVLEAARAHVNSWYWPGEKVHSMSDLTAADIATEKNMQILRNCSALLYLQFYEMVHPSSALIQLGCAMGWRLKTTIITQADLHQPFMLDGFGGVAASLTFLPKARVYRVRSVAEACDLVRRNGRELLGLA